MEKNRVFTNETSIFDSFNQYYEIYSSFRLDKKKLNKVLGPNNLMISLKQKIDSIKAYDSISVSNLKIDEHYYLYFFLFENEIFIIDQNLLRQNEQYFKTKYKSFLYFDNKCKSQFKNSLEECTPNSKKVNFSENKIESIQIKISNCFLEKSYLKTIEMRRRINLDTSLIKNHYEFDDFIQIKTLGNAAQLHYNLKDRLLYVLKKFNKKDKESQKLYNRELEFYNSISNGNQFISKLFGKFEYEGFNYLVIEYIEGQILLESILNKSIDTFDMIKIIIEIILAVEYVHSKKFVLIDLKFDNVILDSNKRNII